MVQPHPSLVVRGWFCTFDLPIGARSSPPELVDGLRPEAPSPLEALDPAGVALIRDVLRHGGFKPTGRSKPASEYLANTARTGGLGSINTAVDACNVASLHSGFPISVVDADKLILPLNVRIAPPGTSYVFNQSGQEMDISGLICLADAEGFCANAVKDSQRTKTDNNTVRSVTIVWGAVALADRMATTMAWYRTLLEGIGARVELITT